MSFVDILTRAAIIHFRGDQVPWRVLLTGEVAFYGTSIALTPPLVWMLGRVPAERHSIGRSVVWSVALLPAYLALKYAVSSMWTVLAYPPGMPNPLLFKIENYSDLNLLFYGSTFVFLITTAAVRAWEYYQRFREQERAAAALDLERANLRASLSEARIEALQTQLQPHFLFNSLHAISTLVLKGETRAANEMLAHLSRFLRMTLDNADKPTVRLSVELEHLDAYLSVQRARFTEHHLRIETVIDDEARSAEVPNLVFQPLIENSIRHGIASNSGQGRISVRAHVDDGKLTLEVEDNGKGLPAGIEAMGGVGLANIRQRLEQLYPGIHGFTLGEGAEGGALVRITIPFGRRR
jgi:sensor histidine kinase YesM